MSPEANSALFEAITKGDTAGMRRAIADGADVNARGGKSNAAPLGHAVVTTSIRRKDMLEHLGRAGADPDIVDGSGLTPLHRAIQRQDDESAATLLDIGANVNAANSFGYTPLHIAVVVACASSSGWYGMIELLLKRGADILATTPDGKTPADLARTQAATTTYGSMVVSLLEPHEKQAITTCAAAQHEKQKLRAMEQEDVKLLHATRRRADFNHRIEDIRKRRPPPLKSRGLK